ncbi:hypothetical protein OPV22_024434 [Ensete ventricosum]|uniref:Uncharacterized protein n=1 Tax=Ensete ventricosum TaxID=4639 RepID=A0AAV8Q4P9_ENSVE|nr:hypothetical protein OPV22_024434 [Ensete ventricosum]
MTGFRPNHHRLQRSPSLHVGTAASRKFSGGMMEEDTPTRRLSLRDTCAHQGKLLFMEEQEITEYRPVQHLVLLPS